MNQDTNEGELLDKQTQVVLVDEIQTQLYPYTVLDILGGCAWQVFKWWETFLLLYIQVLFQQQVGKVIFIRGSVSSYFNVLYST